MFQKDVLILAIITIVCGTGLLNASVDSSNGEYMEYHYDDEVLRNLLREMEALKLENENFLKLLKLRMELRDAKVNDAKINQEIIRLKNLLLETKELLANTQFSIDEQSRGVHSNDSPEWNHQNSDNDAEYPSSCADALKYGKESGIYKLHLPQSGLKPFAVHCLQDPEGGPAWTVVQRRQDGSTNFYRGWMEYKNGFGNVNNEYFIGLENLYALTTKAKPQALWILMKDYEGITRYAKYDEFAIGSEDSQYTMNALGRFRGNAGDSLAEHRGSKFSTKDRDNDETSEKNCAVRFTGAWWYHHCYQSNLNGAYGKDKAKKGIVWFSWHPETSLKYIHMAIRPKEYNT